MSLHEQFGPRPDEQAFTIFDRFEAADDTMNAKVEASLQIVGEYADLLSDELRKVYEDPTDPDIAIQAWSVGWSSLDSVLKTFFHKSRHGLLSEIDQFIRSFGPKIDPLSIPIDNPDPAIQTFYQRFGKTLPKPITVDTPPRRHNWS